MVSAADLPPQFDKLGKRLKALFQVAMVNGRTAVIFFDEIDTIFSTRATS